MSRRSAGWAEMERLKSLSDDELMAEACMHDYVIAEARMRNYAVKAVEDARHREIFWTGIGYVIGGILLALGARAGRKPDASSPL